jgi:hypothetical protein
LLAIQKEAAARIRVAVLHHVRNESQHATRVLTGEVLPLVRQIQDPVSQLKALASIADTLCLFDKLDLAMDFLRQELLPRFESLGDKHSSAVTHGRIANIHHSRGEFDEELRIRQELELPVYKAFGDHGATAGTLMQMCRILQWRGRLDEALELRLLGLACANHSVIPSASRLRSTQFQRLDWCEAILRIRSAEVKS